MSEFLCAYLFCTTRALASTFTQFLFLLLLIRFRGGFVSLFLFPPEYSFLIPLPPYFSSQVLMEGTPKYLDYTEVMGTFLQIGGVVRVHNLRIWALSINKIALSAHLAVGEYICMSFLRALCASDFRCWGRGVGSVNVYLEGFERGAYQVGGFERFYSVELGRNLWRSWVDSNQLKGSQY